MVLAIVGQDPGPLAKPTPFAHRVDRLPRFPGRADLGVWRLAARGDALAGLSRGSLFVRADDAEAIDSLRKLGLPIEQGRWQFVHLDGQKTLDVLSAPGRLQLRTTQAHRPMLAKTVYETRAAPVHAGTDLQQRYRGEGVLVGIIDTGIDLTHPSFLGDDGRSRVLSVWDQDAARGNAPRRLGYGHECRRQDILEERCTITDAIGHGTHVAGIAAGRDGVAPGADIAVVRSDSFTRLADAVFYLVELADDRDQALVINLSVGGHYGPHDGRTPLEEYLDETAGEGRIIVAAAGNDGAGQVHVGLDLAERTQRVALEGLAWGRGADTIIELWSEPTAQADLALEYWVDNSLVGSVALEASESDFLDGTLRWENQTVVNVSYGVDVVPEHKRARRTLILDASASLAPPANGFVALRLRGAGRVDGWISQSDYRYGLPRFGASRGAGWIAGDGERSVTVPATARSIIAVGSYTIRLQWTSEDAQPQLIGPGIVGELSSFSGIGPTLAPSHTGFKPDITAPGSMIISARALSVAPGPNTLDAQRLVLQGTSMAAPHVTGAIALMLEADAKLTPGKARRHLRESATGDAHTGTLPNDRWGHGKLNSLGAVQRAEAQASGCAALAASPLAVLAALLALTRRRAR